MLRVNINVMPQRFTLIVINNEKKFSIKIRSSPFILDLEIHLDEYVTLIITKITRTNTILI